MDQEKIDAIRAEFAERRAALADMLGRDSGVVVAAGIKCGMSVEDVRAALLKTPQALAPLAALDAAESDAAQRAAVSATGDETPKAPEGA